MGATSIGSGLISSLEVDHVGSGPFLHTQIATILLLVTRECNDFGGNLPTLFLIKDLYVDDFETKIIREQFNHVKINV